MKESTKEKAGQVFGYLVLSACVGALIYGARERAVACNHQMTTPDPTDKQVCEALCDQMIKVRSQDSKVPVECWREGCLEACGCAALGHLELPCAEMPVPPCFDPDIHVLLHESLRELIELKRKEMSPR